MEAVSFSKNDDTYLAHYSATLYLHVTVHPNRFLIKQPTRRTNYPYLFCYKTVHVSGISAHLQEYIQHW
jgi:hypothetical protein